MDPILSNVALVAMLEAWRAGPGTAVVVQLFKNDFTPTETSVLADFIEADFSGYAEIAAQEFDPAYLNEAGRAQVTGDTVLTWTQNATTIGNSVYGYMVLTTGGALLYSERFASPQPMQLVGDKIQMVIRASLPWGLGASVLEEQP